MLDTTTGAFGLAQKIERVNHAQIIDLGLGEPRLSHFPIELITELSHIKEIHRYYPSFGDFELREKIIKKYYPGLSVENLAITHGAIGAIDFIFRSHAQTDAEVLLPDPGFVPYENLAKVSGLKIKKYRINMSNLSDELIDWDHLEGLITDKTKLILINSPHNPTGKVFTAHEKKCLITILNRYPQLTFIYDEVYRDLIFDRKTHTELSDIIERGYIIGSFSKMYPLQGARIGWVLTTLEKLATLAVYFNNCTGSISSFGQELAKGMLKRNTSFLEAYAAAKEYAQFFLNLNNVEYIYPSGSFFIFINTFQDDLAFTSLLSHHGIIAIPGSSFGEGGRGHIRISFAQENHLLQSGLETIVSMLPQKESCHVS
jgi:aspartate aminotransferase